MIRMSCLAIRVILALSKLQKMEEFRNELFALGDKISASRIEFLTKKAIKLTLRFEYVKTAKRECRLGAMYVLGTAFNHGFNG